MIGSEYEIQVRSVYAGNVESSPTSTYLITGMSTMNHSCVFDPIFKVIGVCLTLIKGSNKIIFKAELL